MLQTIGISSFRANMSECMQMCDDKPIVLSKRGTIYVMMREEHYIQMVNRIKLPHVVQIPHFLVSNVQIRVNTPLS